MWKRIVIIAVAWYGEQPKKVRLDQVTGTGNNYSFRLSIDGYLRGDFFKRGSRWIAPSDLTSDDTQILAELIDEAFSYPRLTLTLKVPFGDQYRKTYLFEESPGVFVLYIDKEGYEIYQGTMWKKQGTWTGLFPFGGWNYISGMDVLILGDIIEESIGLATNHSVDLQADSQEPAPGQGLL